MKSWDTFVGNLRTLGIILMIGVSLPACQNSEKTETQQEQLKNDSSGMDKDHTAAPPDTLALPSSGNSDTSQISNGNASADSLNQKQ
jgi:hypothetical protein